LGWTEEQVLASLREMKEIGLLLRLGPILDTRGLGYASTLVAVSAQAGDIDRLAAAVGRWKAVTHSYGRRHRFNLWFTLTLRSTEELNRAVARCRPMEGVKELRDLRTLKKYKADTRYPLSRHRFSPCPCRASAAPPDRRDLDLLSLLSDGLDLVPRPFEGPANALGIAQDALLDRLAACMEAGHVRRFSGVLSHRSLGFRKHLLCIKEPAPGEADSIAEALQERAEISHLYLREDKAQDRLVFCAMVHCRSETHWLRLREETPLLQTFQALETTRCYKRSPFRIETSL